MKILLVRLGALGDIVHALPVAAALRRQYPSAQVDWLADARYSRFLELVPVIDRRFVVAAGGGGNSPDRNSAAERRFAGGVGWLNALGALRHERYDVAVDLQGLLKSALLARSSGAKRVLGFAAPHLRERAASMLYGEHCVPPAGGHVVWKNLSALAALGVPLPSRPEFPLARGDASAVEEALRSRPGMAGGFALLNPGAAWPNKRWPAERFSGLAVHLESRHGLASLVVWGPREESLARRVVDGAAGSASLAPPTSLPGLLELARSARLLVSGDTGPLHLAAAAGTPVVALFGPTDPDRNGPWDSSDVSVSRYDSCECRYKRRCRRQSSCIADISLDEVIAAVDRRLASVRSGGPEPSRGLEF